MKDEFEFDLDDILREFSAAETLPQESIPQPVSKPTPKPVSSPPQERVRKQPAESVRKSPPKPVRELQKKVETPLPAEMEFEPVNVPAVQYAPPKQRKEKKRLGFYPKLLVSALIALAVIGIGLVVFWNFIDAYERSRPDNVMNSFLENTDNSYWLEGLTEIAAGRTTYFESADEVTREIITPALQASALSYHKKVSEYTDEKPVYTLRLGSAELARVVLTPAEKKAGFGFNLWEIEKIELQTNLIDMRQNTVQITASSNATVKVNGLDVSSDYLIDSDIEYAYSYLIDGLFLDASVEVYSASGELLEPYFNEGGQYYYAIEVPEVRKYTISAPEGTVITVSDQSFNISELGGTKADSAPYLITAELEVWLFSDVALSATDASGNTLSQRVMPDGKIAFAGPFSTALEEEHKGTVDTFMRAYVDYSSNKGGNTYGNLTRLESLIVQGTPLQEHVRGAWDAMTWVNGSTTTIDKLESSDYTAYGEECFTCEATLATTTTTNYQTRETNNLYELTFVKSGGNWLAVQMIELQGE